MFTIRGVRGGTRDHIRIDSDHYIMVKLGCWFQASRANSGLNDKATLSDVGSC